MTHMPYFRGTHVPLHSATRNANVEVWRSTLQPILDSARDAELLCQAAELLARASIPEEVLRAIRIGRMTALQKPTGGVRGIVAGDIIRRLVSRTIAQQIRTKVEKATAPFQYALSTRAGCECIAHAIQAMTDANPRCTVLSVDGIGAYDTISRRAMLSGLVRHMEGGDSVLPFVLQFYGTPSSYLWEDSEGVVHEVLQGEGGEQGDALMPALFSLGQHGALVAIHKGGWRRMSVSWRFWMTSTLCEIGQSVQEPLTLRSRRSCGPTQASRFTRGRHNCGIELELHRQAVQH